MATTLTNETIESVINALPIQGRIMLRLLLLQYLDTTLEDVEFIATDRPDPRFQSGGKPFLQVVARETIQGITDRIAQYRNRSRQKREQTWLQIDCLRKQIAYGEAVCAQAERLLRERFGVDADTMTALRTHARAAIPKPAMRELDRQWDKNEIEEDEYRRKRLGIEYQTELRKLDRERKRLDTAQRDYSIAGHAPLHDSQRVGRAYNRIDGQLGDVAYRDMNHHDSEIFAFRQNRSRFRLTSGPPWRLPSS